MRTSVNLTKNEEHINASYASWVKMAIEMIKPKDLYLVAGRAMAKTTDIQASRFKEISYDMQHAWFAWAATTYMDAIDNIVPSLIEGLERQGWVEGKHFVTDVQPPRHFLKPYKSPKSYKHTISTFLGTFTQIVSMDQVTSAAGGSFQHLFVDEAKNTPDKRIKKLFPAIRGGDYLQFGRSIYYRGRTMTTDMPNLTENEYDWILSLEKEMDVEQMRKIMEVFLVLNDYRIKFQEAYVKKDVNALRRLRKNIIRWKSNYHRVRKDSSLFLVASTFANVDILTQGYFEEVLASEGPFSFRTTIVSLKPTISKGDRFYQSLGEHHFYDDGVRKEFYDNFNLRDNIKATSEALRYVDTNKKLEIGVDFGNMCSAVVGQPRGAYYYVLKNFYTLAPEELPELAEQILKFFRNHKEKVIDLYYDRTGNQYQQINRDWASDLKHHLEYDNERATGWTVNLRSRDQGNIEQAEEYKFMLKLMGETVEGLPKLKIDKYQAKELKSSLELSKVKINRNSKGNTVIQKNKSSEKLPLHQLPMFSTNFSDAFKYLLCRRSYLNQSLRRRKLYVD